MQVGTQPARRAADGSLAGRNPAFRLRPALPLPPGIQARLLFGQPPQLIEHAVDANDRRLDERHYRWVQLAWTEPQRLLLVLAMQVGYSHIRHQTTSLVSIGIPSRKGDAEDTGCHHRVKTAQAKSSTARELNQELVRIPGERPEARSEVRDVVTDTEFMPNSGVDKSVQQHRGE